MRFAWIVVLGACGFQAHAISEVSDSGGVTEDATAAPGTDAAVDPPDAGEVLDAGTALDAGIAIDAPGGSDAATPSEFCDAADPHLVACYELDGTTHDGSKHHLDATMTDVAFAPGKAGEALQLGAASAVDVTDSAALDVHALTIEAWIRPAQLPRTGRMAYVVDVDRQYALLLRAQGGLSCALPGVASTTALDRMTAGQWHHVACTYDGTTIALYLDGERVRTAKGGRALSTAGTTGMTLGARNPAGSGSPLIGLLDQVRLFDLPRTAAQICADAGQLDCP
jgi:hypothetical protein